ncbi:MAG: hypothetical protein ABIH65_03985 [Nanoarchaeota archaeon]
MKKNHEIRIKLDLEELNKIKQKAKSLGLTASQFLRLLGLNSKLEISS